MSDHRTTVQAHFFVITVHSNVLLNKYVACLVSCMYLVDVGVSRDARNTVGV